MHAELLLIVVCSLGQAERPAPADVAATESVEIRYARAQLQLAEANLRRVQQMNQRLSRTVPASVVAEYELDLETAKVQLDEAIKGGANAFSVWLRRAEGDWKSATTEWKNLVAVNQRGPGTIEALDVDRLRLRAEVARLQFERGQSLASASREAQLQWQVDLLNNQLQRVREDANRTSPFTHFYPIWR